MKSGVELLSHKYPLIETKKNEKLQIKLKLNGHVLEGELYMPNFLNKVGEEKVPPPFTSLNIVITFTNYT